jgi:Transcriptional antiterminator
MKQTSIKTSSEIAADLGVSTRSVKNYIKEINSGCDHPVILATKSGYQIDHSLARHLLANEDTSPDIPQSYKERALFIIRKLLIGSSDKWELEDLCERLYISESTLRLTISQMNKMYSNFNVIFEIKKDFLEIRGLEISKRHLISSTIFEETSTKLIDISIIKDFFSDLDVNEVSKNIQAIFKAHNCYIDHFTFNNLLLHIIININRIIEGNCITCKIDKSDIMEIGGAKSSLLNELCNYLEQEFFIQLNSNERFEIFMLVNAYTNFNNLGNLKKVVNEEMIDIATHIAGIIKEHYFVDIDNDSFVVPFSLHLEKLQARLKGGFSVKNPLTESIKTACPTIYDMAIFATVQLQNKYNHRLPEDEVAFLALHIGAEIERQKLNLPKIKCALLCPDYRDMRITLYNKLLFEFHDCLNIFPPVSYESELNGLAFNLLITTVCVKDSSGYETVRISPFMLDTDKFNIYSAIGVIEQKNKNKILKEHFDHFFQNRLFFAGLSFASNTDAIRFLSSKLMELGYIQEEFLFSVLERENQSSTAFNHFAIPHSIKLNALKSNITILTSKNGIPWGNNIVNVVFLIAINRTDKALFSKLYDALVSLLNDESIIRRIRDSATFEEFKEILLSNTLVDL